MNSWEIETGARQAAVCLTQRELEVLNLIVTGKGHRDIAEELFLSPRTIDFHARQIYAKLGVHNRLSAFRAATRLGILNQDLF